MKCAVLFAILGLALNAAGVTPPTATEALKLRVRCKQMAEEKFQSMREQPLSVEDGASRGFSAAAVEARNRNLPQEVHAHYASRYDAINNRCYAEVFIQTHTKTHDVEHRQIFDVEMDDLLASAQILNGKKSGTVFDTQHRTTTDSNLGWDDANAYIDGIMADKRK